MFSCDLLLVNCVFPSKHALCGVRFMRKSPGASTLLHRGCDEADSENVNDLKVSDWKILISELISEDSMKLIKLSSIMLVALFAIGCAQTLKVQRGTLVPAATAKAKVTKDDHGNAKLRLDVERLAPPTNLSPPRKTYMVWAQANSGSQQRLGALTVSEEGEGSFEAVVPMSNFKVVVTAEDGREVEKPTGPMVLWTDPVTLN